MGTGVRSALLFGLLGLVACATGSSVTPRSPEHPAGPGGVTAERDTIPTSGGDLEITFLGHATLMFRYEGHVIHVDPVRAEEDPAKLPKADLILVTHDHGDHLDPVAIATLSRPGTVILLPKKSEEKLGRGTVMSNGDVRTVLGLRIEAVPAYNLVHRRPSGDLYHPKGVGNGYVIDFADLRVYVAGDTENIPEMKALKGVGVAFLPMNLPYTMTPEMVADAAKSFHPRILYPYHYGKTDPAALLPLLKGTGIEVRIRKMR